jgi:hypothetical protein
MTANRTLHLAFVGALPVPVAVVVTPLAKAFVTGSANRRDGR